MSSPASQSKATDVDRSTTTSTAWNTTALGSRLGVDLLSAAASGLTVAPTVSIIDRAIIENTSNQATLLQSFRTSLYTLATKPHAFFFAKPFALIFMVYGSTYLSANLVDTLLSTLSNKPPAHQTSGTAKFAATSTTNLGLSLIKDGQFTKMFGASSAAGPVPRASYLLFMARDSLTVFASFNLPPILAPALPMANMETYVSRASAAQFLCPAAIQAFSTPLHLLGLDLYNRPKDVGWAGRAGKIVGDWGKSCAARVGRIVPAFGVGGVVNREVRGWGMGKFVE